MDGESKDLWEHTGGGCCVLPWIYLRVEKKSWSGEARGAPGAGGGGLDQDGALERTMTLDFRQVYLGPGQEGGECPLSLGVSQAALGPPSPQA